MTTFINSQENLTACTVFKLSTSLINEDFVKVNSSQGLLPYHALLKTCIYYSHTITSYLVVHSFKVLSGVFFKETWNPCK